MTVTGPSSTQPSYLVSDEPNVRFVSIITTGDPIPGSGTVFAGIPDGLGAFDNGDGTFTVLVNHELGGSLGTVRDHGSTGAYIDRLIIDKATLAVVSGDDAIQSVRLWNDVTDSYFTGTTQFNRFCSGDLAQPSAFYNAESGLGSTARIYLTGEEAGAEGRVFATILTGSEAGTAYELPFLGNMSYENAVANPLAQNKTLVFVTDDSSPGETYLYVGNKQATGTEIEKAGLSGGTLYGIKVTGVADESNGTAINGQFSLAAIPDASNLTGAQIEAQSEGLGVTDFLRPEDAAWDPSNPNVLYFVTTNSFTGNSRLYKLTFTDVTNPEAGGTITALLDGSEGQRMFDNITVADGKIILQEDPGNQSYIAKVWEYDIASDTLVQVANFDPAKFTPGAPGFITQDEESSGVVDVSAILGDSDTRAYLLDAQIHTPSGNPATVEPGQLTVMYVDTPKLIGGNGNDTLFGSAANETLRGGNGDDSARAGSGTDLLYGGRGNDRLDGGAGDDQLYGERGNDGLIGGAGNDLLSGGPGRDIFYFDNLKGGTGQDTITDFAKGDRIFVTEKLADLNMDGIIELSDGSLNFSSYDGVALGDGLEALRYMGTVEQEGVTYYSYSAGPGAGNGHAAHAMIGDTFTAHADAPPSA